MMKLRLVTLGLLACIGLSATIARGDGDDETKLARAARLDEMTKRWQVFKASLVRDDKEIELEPCPEPLLRWSDPARKDTPIRDGTLWAWGPKGRPAALLTQESYGGKWACELISASTDRIAVVTSHGWRWSPEKPAFQLLEFKDAPSPAEDARARLARMRALARRFEITQIGHDKTRYNLRFMPQPIHRYNDTAVGLIDGALFAFAWGTNPETIVVVECRRQQAENHWFYGFLPVTVARVEAKIDGRNVWSRPPEYQPQLQRPYAAFSSE